MSSDVSAVLPKTTGNNASDSDYSQPQNLVRLKDYSDDSTPTHLSRPNNSPEDQHSGTGATNPNSGLGEQQSSAVEEFRKLHDLLCALATALKNPNSVSEHNEVKTTLKAADTSKYWTRTSATEHFFKFAEQVDGCDPKYGLSNSFIRRTAG